ncbi:hypothetical protein NRB_53220 [Novosphingobium sp. 11B]
MDTDVFPAAVEQPGIQLVIAGEAHRTHMQVADRWQMLRNCSDAVLAAMEKRYRIVREVGRSLAQT